MLETRALDPSAVGQTYKVHDIYDLGWSTAGYVALVLDEDGEPRIIMADHMGDKFGSPRWAGVFSVGAPMSERWRLARRSAGRCRAPWAAWPVQE